MNLGRGQRRWLALVVAVATFLTAIPQVFVPVAHADGEEIAIITTIAGTGLAGKNGDGGPATSAQLSGPNNAAVDDSGNVYIADSNNNRIRKISTNGTITTIAGNGTPGFSGDYRLATQAQLNQPTGIALDGAGNVYIADTDNSRIRKVGTDGLITTVAGTNSSGFSGDSGWATGAQLNRPQGVAVDSSGNIYISDTLNNKVRKVGTNGVITTIAGKSTSGGFGGDGGAAKDAQLSTPISIAVDNSGNVFIADTYNHRIRKIDTLGKMNTIAGGTVTATQLSNPSGVAVDLIGNVYVADSSNNRIMKLDTDGSFSSVAGTGAYGSDGEGGRATSAQFKSPRGVAVDRSGHLYISDYSNNKIRKIAPVDPRGVALSALNLDSGRLNPAFVPGILSYTANVSERTNSVTIELTADEEQAAVTVNGVPTNDGHATVSLSMGTNRIAVSVMGVEAPTRTYTIDVTRGAIISTVAGTGVRGSGGDGGAATAAQLYQPYAVALDRSGALFVVDTFNQKVRKIATDGNISTIAGTGSVGFSGDGGAATLAQLNQPRGIALDSSGNVYVGDNLNHRIRKISTDGTITTIAGTGTLGFTGDGGPAIEARLSSPTGVAVDGQNNVYVADTSNHRIRKIGIDGTITTIAGTGVGGYNGDGQLATSAKLNTPTGVAIDSGGVVYIAETSRIRKVSTDGIISTVAGTSIGGYSGDGGLAQETNLYIPYSVAVGNNGDIYVADTHNSLVRRISADGIISIVAGTPMFLGGGGDEKAPTKAELFSPRGLAIDQSGVIYIVDDFINKIRKISQLPKSSDTALTELTLSSGILSPEFTPGTLSYTAVVANNVDSIIVTPTASDSLAAVRINGRELSNGEKTVNLNVGSNMVDVVVTAEDGITTRTYTVEVTREVSSDATLSGLSLSSGTLSPVFAAATLGYTATVGNNVNSITVSPTASDSLATVRVNDRNLVNGEKTVNLNVGSNTITVEVVAADGVTVKTYTVEVTREASSDATLSGLGLSSGTPSPVFAAATLGYTATVGNNVDSIIVTPTASDSLATVRVNDRNLVNGEKTVNLNVGGNTITVEVVAADGVTVKTYTVEVTREASSDATLSGLGLSSGTLSPVFTAATLGYTATVGNNVDSIIVTPTASDSLATVRVNDRNLVNGEKTVNLNVGSNTITVEVVAADGVTVKTYTVEVTREASSDATLSGLGLSSGTLSPVFGAATLGYTATVGNNVDSIIVTPTASDSLATVRVNDRNLVNGEKTVNLNVGSNTITVEVVAADGVTVKTYTVEVTREASSDATLSSLSLSSGTLSPVFTAVTLGYTATVGNNVDSIIVTPTASNSLATVRVNDRNLVNGEKTVNLNVGSNTITVEVIAADGVTVKTYTVEVTREASSDATLSSLSLSNGTLSPVFTAGTLSYTAIVGNNVDSITVSPTAGNSHATLTVDGTEVANGQGTVNLNVGSNTITVVVTAEDGSTTKTYTITVTRAAAEVPKSNDATLSGLGLSSGTLSPVFRAGTLSYTATVGNNVDSITVTPAVSDSHATLTVNGTEITNGQRIVNLNVGNNTITVVVTAEDEITTKSYTITVTRAAAEVPKSNDSTLSGLSLGHGTLSPAFAAGTLTYTATVTNSVYSVAVMATANEGHSTVKVNGEVISTNGQAVVNLNEGSNVITVLVTAEDQVTTRTYTILVIREAAETPISSDATLLGLGISSGTLSPAFAAGTLTYTATVTNSVYSLAITPTASDSHATVTVNGEVVSNGQTNVNLNVGSNTITVVVTAEDQTTTTYTILVIREAAPLPETPKSNDATLSGLTLSGTSLTPAFNTGTYVYNASVTNSVYSLTVMPITTESHATITVNGTAVTNGQAVVNLNVGSNVIMMIVTAEDGTTKPYTITVNRASSSPDFSEETPNPSTVTPSQAEDTGAEVLVNGKAEKAGELTTIKSGVQTISTLAVDETKLQKKLEQEGNNARVTLAVNSTSEVIIGELNGQMVKNMEIKEAVLEVRAPSATYVLPAKQMDIDAISEKFGRNINLQDIKVQIRIEKPDAEAVNVVENAAKAGQFTIVAPPVEFTLTFSDGTKTVEMSQFNSYVERTILIPEGIDPSKITTGVVVDADGTTRHVPTKVQVIDGKYYAVINSLTNSLYSVVWNPLEFKDVEGHWAKMAVNDMGSRLVIYGLDNGIFKPDDAITRAEFAAIMVRGLGLKPVTGKSPFADVRESDWYQAVVQTAYVYKLIDGFEDGTFRPEEKITREQATVILAKAMALTGLQAKLPAQAGNELLKSFADAGEVSQWAKESVMVNLKAGILSGRSAHELSPQESITRAEVAALIQRLLKSSGLI